MGYSRLGLCFFVSLAVGAQVSSAAPDGQCSVPLKLRGGVPFVKVLLNGRGPFTFLVDTGTGPEAIVSPALVKELNLAPAGRRWLLDVTATDRQSVDEVSIETLALASRRFRSVRAIVHEPVATMGRYDGVLGFALFRDSMLTLDFPGRCLRLEQEEGLTQEADNVLPFTMPRNIPQIAITVGNRTVPAQIDSGGGGISLPASSLAPVEFFHPTEVQVRVRTQVETFFIRGGVINGDVALGGHVFKEPFVEISERIPVANLGAASLQDFVITFDQHNNLVRFQARKNTHRLFRTQLEEWTPHPGEAGGG